MSLISLKPFSLIIKPYTIRFVLTLVVSKGWVVGQVDINNAFLNVFLVEYVYMKQREGFVYP